MTNPKPPTDAAILKSFQKYEEGMNTCLAVLRAATPYDAHAVNMVYGGHQVFREVAVGALNRQERKRKKGEDAK